MMRCATPWERERGLGVGTPPVGTEVREEDSWNLLQEVKLPVEGLRQLCVLGELWRPAQSTEYNTHESEHDKHTRVESTCPARMHEAMHNMRCNPIHRVLWCTEYETTKPSPT